MDYCTIIVRIRILQLTHEKKVVGKTSNKHLKLKERPEEIFIICFTYHFRTRHMDSPGTSSPRYGLAH